MRPRQDRSQKSSQKGRDRHEAEIRNILYRITMQINTFWYEVQDVSFVLQFASAQKHSQVYYQIIQTMRRPTNYFANQLASQPTNQSIINQPLNQPGNQPTSHLSSQPNNPSTSQPSGQCSQPANQSAGRSTDETRRDKTRRDELNPKP